MNYIEIANAKLYNVADVVEDNGKLAITINASEDAVRDMVSDEQYGRMLWKIRIVDEDNAEVFKYYEFCSVDSINKVTDTSTVLTLCKSTDICREQVLDLLVELYEGVVNLRAYTSNVDNVTSMTVMPIIQSIIKEE